MITAPVLFTLTTLILLGLILIIAMLRYPPEHALKVWAIAGPMLGSTIGAGSAFFFAQKSVEQVKEMSNAQVASLAQTVSSFALSSNKETQTLQSENRDLKQTVTYLAANGPVSLYRHEIAEPIGGGLDVNIQAPQTPQTVPPFVVPNFGIEKQAEK